MPDAVTLDAVAREPTADGSGTVELRTSRGAVACRLHASGGDAGILWVFGAGGGLGAPAGGVYARLGPQFAARGEHDARHRREAAVEPEIADDEILRQRLGVDDTYRGEQPACDREIVVRAIFRQGGGRQVDRDAWKGSARPVTASVARTRSFDSLTAR